MSDSQIPQKAPYVVEAGPGEVYWCSCGSSSTQPFCDGSHTGAFQPKVVNLEQKEKKRWCGCKQSAKAPYCDGSHARL